MIVIADSNIIISALITPNGIVASIFKAKSNLQFITSNLLFEEIENHLDKIVKLSGRKKAELRKDLQYFRNRIKEVYLDNDIPQQHINEAYYITMDVDAKDLFFIALQRYKRHKLWTSDLELIRGVEQKGYKIFITTAELKAKLYKK